FGGESEAMPASTSIGLSSLSSKPEASLPAFDFSALPKLTLPDFGAAFDSLKSLSFDDVLNGIIEGVAFLEEALEEQPFYVEQLPVVNRSLADTLDFVGNLAEQVESLKDNPSNSIQALETKVEQVLGIKDDNSKAPHEQDFALIYKDGVVNAHLSVRADLNEKFNFALDLETLREMAGGAVADMLAVIDDFADISGSGVVSLDAFAHAVLDFGIDLSDPGKPDFFLLDYNPDFDSQLAPFQGTHLFLGGRILGEGLEMAFGIGPNEISVREGSVTLDGDAKAATDDFVNAIVTLDQKAG
ncbi:uncharacterized protein METZ01_LOCUS378431, partial [marine metagenome]